MTDLISLDDYKEYKNINSTARDGYYQTIITAVSALIENYCNRKFLDHAVSGSYVVEWFDGKTSKVYLKEFPVIEVVSVAISSDGGVTQEVLTEGASDLTGYFVDLEEGSVFTQLSCKKFITSYNIEYRSLEITYRAGYEDLDNLPADLKLCVLDLVHYYVKDEKEPTKSLLGATIDNPLPYVANSFPPHIRRVLDLYRYGP